MNQTQKKLISGFLNRQGGLFAEPYQTSEENGYCELLSYGIPFAWCSPNGTIDIERLGLTYDMEQAIVEIKKLVAKSKKHFIV